MFKYMVIGFHMIVLYYSALQSSGGDPLGVMTPSLCGSGDL